MWVGLKWTAGCISPPIYISSRPLHANALKESSLSEWRAPVFSFPLQIYSKATIFRSSSLTELTLSIRLSNQLFTEAPLSSLTEAPLSSLTGAPLSSIKPTLTELLLLQGPFLR